jgi:hypothetical protein
MYLLYMAKDVRKLFESGEALAVLPLAVKRNGRGG